MNNYRDIFVSLGWRALIAAPFFLLGLTAGPSLLSPFLIVVGAIILASPLARFLAEPAGGLFYPVRHFSRPQPMYSIPQSMRAKGLYEEALAGFEEIARTYPIGEPRREVA